MIENDGVSSGGGDKLNSLHPLLAVVGPTGSGKSDLALYLAEEFGGEIVNCDSVQLYRHLNIGTAKLPVGDRRGIPHHLIDIIDPDVVFTAGDYVRIARPLLAEITRRGRIPIVTGGTGFYFRALINGLFEGPARNENLRTRLLQRPGERLYRLLERLDATAASRIHRNDTKKVVRALEVCLLTRRPLSVQQPNRKALADYRTLTIGLAPPRDQLSEKINIRCAEMFRDGLIEEVKSILAMGFSPEAKALESIGYREAMLHIAGEISYAQAVELSQAATRQYAKRQRTWFRREKEVHWLPSFGNHSETIENAKCLVVSLQKS